MSNRRLDEMGFSEVPAVVNRAARRIDLSQQDNAVTAAVLEDLRDVLHLNDFYISLSLSNNVLYDDGIAMLCAILKDKTYLETVELQSCGLRDKDFIFYVVPAILSRGTVKHLSLNKNTGLTDSSAEAICRLIRDGGLTELHLLGTSLTHAGGEQITEAISTNGSLSVCSLPYTVGFEVLDRAAALLQRNNHHMEMMRGQNDRATELASVLEAASAAANNSLADRVMASPMAILGDGSPLKSAKSRAQSVPKPAGGATAVGEPARNIGLEVGPAKQERYDLARYRADRGRKNALLSAPSFVLTRSSVASLPSLSQHSRILCRRASGDPLLRLPPLQSSAADLTASPRMRAAHYGNEDIGSLDQVRLRDWADPAVRGALAQLHLLSERGKLRDDYRSQARAQLREQRGLATAGRRNNSSSSGRSTRVQCRGKDAL